jgi:uncharacterized protein (DUF305 family)
MLWHFYYSASPMLTVPRLLLFLLPAALLLPGCNASPDTTTTASATSNAAVDKDAPSGLLSTSHAMTQRLAAAPPTLTPDQEAARQLTEYGRGAVALAAVALAAVEARQGRDSTLRRWATAMAQDQQPVLAADALVDRPGLPPAAGTVLRQRLRTTVNQLVQTEQATRVEAAGRRAQAPNLGMMQSHEGDGTGDVDADFATILLLQQRAALETANTVEALGSGPALRAAATEVQRRAQPLIRQLQAWQAQRSARL